MDTTTCTRKECRETGASLCNSVGDVGGDGNAKRFVLECLDHQHNPQHDTQKPNQEGQAETKQEKMSEAQHNVNQIKAAKNDDRLGRMELHERPLVNEKKNDARSEERRVG